jgi:hypothetical protein
MPISPKFWTMVGLSARAADVIVQKNFFHYRIMYALVSFHHLPVVSAGATSLIRVGQKQTRVPTYPTTDLPDWRKHEPLMRQQPRR